MLTMMLHFSMLAITPQQLTLPQEDTAVLQWYFLSQMHNAHHFMPLCQLKWFGCCCCCSKTTYPLSATSTCMVTFLILGNHFVWTYTYIHFSLFSVWQLPGIFIANAFQFWALKSLLNINIFIYIVSPVNMTSHYSSFSRLCLQNQQLDFITLGEDSFQMDFGYALCKQSKTSSNLF